MQTVLSYFIGYLKISVFIHAHFESTLSPVDILGFDNFSMADVQIYAL